MGRSAWKVEVLLPGSWRGATSVLLSSRRHHIVVDTGMSHEARLLLRALKQRGLTRSDITGLINTHFHVDHVLNNSLFPNSAIFASQQSYDWCRALYADLQVDDQWEKLVLKYYPETFDYENAGENMKKLRKIALRWWDPRQLGQPSRFRWIEKHSLPDGLEALVTRGHVPGHISVIVQTESGLAVVAGDALLSRDESAPILTMIPHNREEFQRDRARLLAMRGRILPGHDRAFSTACAGADTCVSEGKPPSPGQSP